MYFRGNSVLAAFALVSLVANAAPLDNKLDKAEIEEVEARIKKFYGNPADPSGINEIPKKYDPETKQFISGSKLLKLKDGEQVVKGSAQKLLEQAQVKATDRFQKHQCDKFLSKAFPKLGCKDADGKASAEGNDSVTDLTDTWIDADDVIYDLDSVKTSAKTKRKLWSDDYWMIKYGITSYRYAEGKSFPKYHDAVRDYAQPAEWAKDPSEATIAKWSPSEKYDITVGDTKFSLTNEQKGEGEDLLNDKNDVEEWMGICHGWAPAAYLVPQADKAVKRTGADGKEVTWYPHDIRAMSSLRYANGDTTTNFVGGRCDVKKVTLQKNGRIAQQECFDNNPSTFHLALANMIGEIGESFVMDKTFDAEVWNQPLVSYEFTYFNPLNPSDKSKEWSEVAVDYDAAFKAKDRFQSPLTRGKRSGTRYDDRGVKKVVGVVASVTYLVEVAPKTGTPNRNATQRVTYTYDLELHKQGSKYVALGGEWHSNAHPDFLWTPVKASSASTDDDSGATYSGKVTAALTRKAASASRNEGYPLCAVIKNLVEESSGEKYSCK